MPEYLAPGVFVEETSFRSKSIEGVSTTTTGFVGPTRYGPLELEPELITSLTEFERTYGSRLQLRFSDVGEHHNYMWHAVRAFFEEGGKRLYISRVFRPTSAEDDGHARTRFTATLRLTVKDKPEEREVVLRFAARYPGASGNMGVRITLRAGQNILSYNKAGEARARALQDKDVVLIRQVGAAETAGDFYQVSQEESGEWTFTHATDTAKALRLANDKLRLETNVKGEGEPQRELYVITATVSTLTTPDSDTSLVWDGLSLDPKHTRSGVNDSLFARFEYQEKTPSRNREIPLTLHSENVDSGLTLLRLLLNGKEEGKEGRAGLEDNLKKPKSKDEDRSVDLLLEGGNDGVRPSSDDYKGAGVVGTTRKTGLMQFEDLEDISIVAAPGATFNYETTSYGPKAATIVNALIAHCERMKYRIAVLDSGDKQTLQQVRAMRAKLDSKYAALYYPWVKVMDPVTQQPIHLPPSGFVAGIYARNDVRRAVYKAPANEVVTSAIGFESVLNTAQQEALNPEGINAFRFFEGRGLRLWGARTVSSDPEWKYVNLRRYFAYLERSIDKGTQWAVFEPNGPALWANIRRSIEDFLLNEWQSGALLGDRPDAAYFVKCDRSTMTQNDLDNGRLVCLVGVAPLRPAEFVIIRIGQWTGDRK